jgi:hypothetical protein
MKKFLFIAVLFSLLSGISYSQEISGPNTNHSLPDDYMKLNISKDKSTNVPDWFGTIAFFTSLVINPEILYENKKVSFGLTKEVSVLLPFINTKELKALSRPGIEYTYVFRDGRNHHLRGFLNFEIPVETSGYIIVTWGIGGGYFTDFKKSGAFPQTSLDMIIPVMEGFALIPYLKLRHTIMFDRTQSDITDLSIGMGFTLMPFFK